VEAEAATALNPPQEAPTNTSRFSPSLAPVQGDDLEGNVDVAMPGTSQLEEEERSVSSTSSSRATEIEQPRDRI
jgi:hypothetical protein